MTYWDAVIEQGNVLVPFTIHEDIIGLISSANDAWHDF